MRHDEENIDNKLFKTPTAKQTKCSLSCCTGVEKHHSVRLRRMQHMQLHCVYYTVHGVLKKEKERRRLRSMLFQVFLYFLNYIYC